MSLLLKSKRLQLREFTPSDAKNLFDLNTDPDVLLYTGDIPFSSIDEAAKFIENYKAYNQYGYGRWAVFENSSNQFIGWCGFKYHKEGYIDLGFRLLKKFWGKGYASEAGRTCIDYGFDALKFSEIVGRTSENNSASINVLEKLGFIFWKKDECYGIENARYYLLKK